MSADVLAQKELKIKWYNRLRSRVLMFFLAMLLLMMLVTSVISGFFNQKIIEHLVYEKLSHSQEEVLMELSQRIEMSTTLLDTIVTAGLISDFDEDFLHTSLPRLLDNQTHRQLIAGGGIWPEPYALDANKFLNSSFYGKSPAGQLIAYEEYNDPDLGGYHNEEWYVPARYLKAGQHYWSKAYVDPHSLEPMVTLTTPIIREEEFIGVATLDLKLEGLQELLALSTESFNGYSFAMDRNGNILSFPVVDHLPSSQQDSIFSFSHFSEFHQNYPSSVLTKIFNQTTPPDSDSERIFELAGTLAANIKGITAQEALKISNRISRKDETHDHGKILHKHPDIETNRISHYFSHVMTTPEEDEIIRIKDDIVVQKSAIGVVTHLFRTDWYLITVIPEDFLFDTLNLLSASLNIAIFIVIILSTFASWVLITRLYLKPFESITEQLKSSNSQLIENNLIETSDKGEISVLAYWINEKAKEISSNKERIKELAFFDSLTGLPNRRMLNDHLTSLLQENEKAPYLQAVMFLDLDHFKLLNDSLGHDIGDQLLIECGNRISRCLNNDDMLARLGGDEFVIVLATNTPYSAEDARKKAEDASREVLNSLAEPFLLDNSFYHVSVSIGIALNNNEIDSANSMLKHADTAMYYSKSKGRNTYTLFETSMQEIADYRLLMENELRKAIESDNLYLMYQPQVTEDGKCRSFEALCRWKHHKKGEIAPHKFISIAEETRLIIPLGQVVLEKVCKTIRNLHQAGAVFDHISVNISPVQFSQPDFVESILKTVKTYEVSPEHIMLEITEGVIIDDPEKVIFKLAQLKGLGFRISIDDFGTGYSSLTYLKRLPLYELKVDRSFISGLGEDDSGTVITETIIAMAESLGYQVIAEGVETEDQKRILITLGCSRFQGYLFSKPVSEDKLVHFLSCPTLNNPHSAQG